MRLISSAAILTAAALLLTSCAANEMAQDLSSGSEGAANSLAGTLNGAGASSQGSAQETWVAAFQTANPQVTVNYDPTGSGAGRKTFAAGGAAFAGSDSALTDEELRGDFESCAVGTKAIDLPVYISPIAIVFNVDGISDLQLDAAVTAGIFKDEITSWRDPAIARLNPGQNLPNVPITAVHRSDDSGTTKNFTDYLSKAAPEVWEAEPADKFPYLVGEGVQGTAGVVDTVRNGVGTIGYADASKTGELGVAKIKVGDEFVAYSAKAAAAIVDASPVADGREPHDIAIILDRTSTEAGVYPIVLISYLITCQTYADPAQAELVKAYAGYIASEPGQAQAAEFAGSAPISPALAQRVQAAVDAIDYMANR